LTGTVSHAQKAALSSRAWIVTTRATQAFGSKATLTVLAAIDDILQALALPRLCDARPVQVFARLGIVDDIGKGGGGNLALAAAGIGCTRSSVQVA
jgi:hypothetical protein